VADVSRHPSGSADGRLKRTRVRKLSDDAWDLTFSVVSRPLLLRGLFCSIQASATTGLLIDDTVH
jgi:hypothetical protein